MIAWLITSRVGRAIALAGAVLLALVTFGASERAKGRKQAENKRNEDRARMAQDAREIDDSVKKASDGDVRVKLGKWMRKDD